MRVSGYEVVSVLHHGSMSGFGEVVVIPRDESRIGIVLWSTQVAIQISPFRVGGPITTAYVWNVGTDPLDFTTGLWPVIVQEEFQLTSGFAPGDYTYFTVHKRRIAEQIASPIRPRIFRERRR